MLRHTARFFAMRIPAIARVISHRDELLQDSIELKKRLSMSLQQNAELNNRILKMQQEGHELDNQLLTSRHENVDLQEKLATATAKAEESILDVYVADPPSREAAFRIFDDAWSSSIPGYGIGQIELFDDSRIKWLAQQCGGFAGKRILELGPLEGGHTYMMSKAGAAGITAIESNTIGFLKCLIVQNTLKFDADFMLGDFRPYLENCTETYDFLLASGVLYHMTEPVTLLQYMARVSRAIGLWTHYYDADAIRGREYLNRRFDTEPRVQQVGSREVVSYKQSYLDALQWNGFCGGTAPVSYWLTRESLLGLLSDLGFKLVMGKEEKDHPNGPAMLLYATR